MSDEDVIVAEVEADPIEAPNPIADLLASIESGQYNDAEQAFKDVIGDRLQDTLDQAKIRIADRMFNNSEEEETVDYDDIVDEDELVDLDFDDEDTAEDEGKEIYAGSVPDGAEENS